MFYILLLIRQPEFVYAKIGHNHGRAVGANRDVAWSDVISSSGSGYSKYSGRFTAPSRGVYLISVNIEWSSTYSTYALKTTRKGAICGMHSDRSSEGLFCTVIIEMLKGEQVYLRVLTGELYTMRYTTEKTQMNSFAVVRLQNLE